MHLAPFSCRVPRTLPPCCGPLKNKAASLWASPTRHRSTSLQVDPKRSFVSWPLLTRLNVFFSWQFPKLCICFSLSGHDEAVTCVSIATELDLAASGSADGTAIVYTVKEGHSLFTIRPRLSTNVPGMRLSVISMAVSDERHIGRRLSNYKTTTQNRMSEQILNSLYCLRSVVLPRERSVDRGFAESGDPVSHFARHHCHHPGRFIRRQAFSAFILHQWKVFEKRKIDVGGRSSNNFRPAFAFG